MSPEPLRNAARRRSADDVARARAAIDELTRSGEHVGFQAVARRAGVSRQWLYTRPELRAEIERLRAAHAGRFGPSVPAPERSSEASLRQRVEGLLEENRRLRNQVGELRGELALAYGRQRETRASAGQSG